MIEVFPDAEALAQAAAEYIAHTASECIAQTPIDSVEERRLFTIALAGGSTPKPLYTMLGAPPWRDELAKTAITWVVVDERYVITGSLNYSTNAEDSNDENVIIIDNPDIAKLYMQDFERVWALATDPEPGKFPCQ